MRQHHSRNLALQSKPAGCKRPENMGKRLRHGEIVDHCMRPLRKLHSRNCSHVDFETRKELSREPSLPFVATVFDDRVVGNWTDKPDHREKAEACSCRHSNRHNC